LCKEINEELKYPIWLLELQKNNIKVLGMCDKDKVEALYNSTLDQQRCLKQYDTLYKEWNRLPKEFRDAHFYKDVPVASEDLKKALVIQSQILNDPVLREHNMRILNSRQNSSIR
jgi:hypothetical protein